MSLNWIMKSIMTSSMSNSSSHRCFPQQARERCETRGVVLKDNAMETYSLGCCNVGRNIVDKDTRVRFQLHHSEDGLIRGGIRFHDANLGRDRQRIEAPEEVLLGQHGAQVSAKIAQQAEAQATGT